MSATVIVNNLTVVHKRSGGSSVAGPDVCKTPTPGGPPVPLPYVNTALSRSTAKGTRGVRVDGESIMLKSSHFSSSVGDEPGSLGGVLSGKFKGKAYPRMYSFDVKVEGQNVFRLTDIMLQNSGSPSNTPPGIETQPNATANTTDPDKLEVVRLEWSKGELACGDPVSLAVDTKNAEERETLTVAVQRTDRKSAARMDQFPVTLRGNRARHRWISRRTAGFAVTIPAEAVQKSARGVERSANKLTFKTVANAKAPLVTREEWGAEYIWDSTTSQYLHTGGWFAWDVCFQMETRDGALIVQRRLDFDNRTGQPITDRMWRAWKREIEAVWDRKFFMHRVQCKRGRRCDCAKQGCCKFPLRIFAERGAGHGQVKLFLGGPLAVNRGKTDLWWYSDTWWTERGEAGSTCVRAHEFGHLIGCFDEYLGGASNPAGVDIEVADSVMEGGSTVRLAHIREFIRWFRTRTIPPVGKTEPLPG